jgi:hypothetical protein
VKKSLMQGALILAVAAALTAGTFVSKAFADDDRDHPAALNSNPILWC